MALYKICVLMTDWYYMQH